MCPSSIKASEIRRCRFATKDQVNGTYSGITYNNGLE
jgi:hypothetical protein